MSLPFDSDLIDAIVISHQHPDHCSDLTAAYHAWTYRPEPREPVPLFAHQTVWDRIVAFVEGEPPCFDFRPSVSGDSATVGGISITFVEADHSVPNLASRWEANDRTLFYTRPDEAMRPYQLWRHVVGTDPADDVLVHQEDDARFYLSVGTTKDDRFVLVHLGSKVTDEVRFLDAGDPTGELRVVQIRFR